MGAQAHQAHAQGGTLVHSSCSDVSSGVHINFKQRALQIREARVDSLSQEHQVPGLITWVLVAGRGDEKRAQKSMLGQQLGPRNLAGKRLFREICAAVVVRTRVCPD
jgi:hypothetical protein